MHFLACLLVLFALFVTVAAFRGGHGRPLYARSAMVFTEQSVPSPVDVNERSDRGHPVGGGIASSPSLRKLRWSRDSARLRTMVTQRPAEWDFD
ncbi:unnamed protein product [Caenorhabditis auriculariae]|uniref:Secreted protein n=1 Tax=Caenorhabditis auriculariae TaxID=2777116 RepID=A0A8S1HW49_9PELO|nr:unnamed protein product [Caenorhabditis auriculariae]